MNDKTATKTAGPRSQKAAVALVAQHLLGHLNASDLDEMFTINGWTDAQVKRAEAAVKDVGDRLRRLAG